MTYQASSRFATLLNLLLLVLAIVVADCNQSPPDDTLVIGLEGNPTNLDPRFALDAHSMRIDTLLYNGLLGIAPNGALYGDLAKGWMWVGPTELVLGLRGGRKFNDGTPIDCPTIKANLVWVTHAENGSPKAAGFEKVDSIQCDINDWLRIKLKEPFAPFLVELTLGIIPIDQLDQKNPAPTGSGPYRVAEWIPDKHVLLERVADHPAGPTLRRIQLRILPEETTRIQEMQKGQLDFLFNAIPNHKLQLLESNPNVRIESRKGDTYTYIGLNLQHPILSNPNVRRALAMATDREQILRERLAGRASLAEGLMAPGSSAYASELKPILYDTEAAALLLDQAGYPMGNPDADGGRFVLRYHTSADAEANVLAEIIKSQWAMVGVKTQIKSFEWGTFFRDVKSGQYDVFSLRWIGVMDPDHLYYVYHSSMVPPKGANRTFYDSPEVDAILEQARKNIDSEPRADAYREVQRILAEDLPVISLFHLDDVAVMSDRLEGMVLFPGGRLTGLIGARLGNRGD